MSLTLEQISTLLNASRGALKCELNSVEWQIETVNAEIAFYLDQIRLKSDLHRILLDRQIALETMLGNFPE